jgi:hypothetical protein
MNRDGMGDAGSQADMADTAMDRLIDVLDTHGGDTRRWPAAAASDVAPLLAANPAARRWLAEAVALDQLLAAAPATSATAPVEFTARVMRAALSEPATVPAVAAPSARGSGPAVRASRSARSWAWPERGMAAGALAASVLVGIWLGGNTGIGPLIDDMLGSPAVEQTADADLYDAFDETNQGQGELL